VSTSDRIMIVLLFFYILFLEFFAILTSFSRKTYELFAFLLFLAFLLLLASLLMLVLLLASLLLLVSLLLLFFIFFFMNFPPFKRVFLEFL
jgi:hypothetical protein